MDLVRFFIDAVAALGPRPRGVDGAVWAQIAQDLVLERPMKCARNTTMAAASLGKRPAEHVAAPVRPRPRVAA